MIPINWTDPKYDYINYTYKFDLRKKNDYNLPPLEAAIKTVNYIKDNYPAPYTLFLSGGVDSQAMLYAWYKSGVPFKTYSGVYNNNLNSEDLKYIKIFADQIGITINFVDFDLFSFLDNEHDFYAKTYYTGSPHYTTYLKMVDSLDSGTAVMAGNLFRPRVYYYNSKTNKPIKVFNFQPGFEKNNLALLHYVNFTNKNFVPFFFIETEYLTHSFTVVPNEKIEESFNNMWLHSQSDDQIAVDISMYQNKVAMYKYNGFPVIEQKNETRGKYTGFESVKDYYDLVLDEKKKSMSETELRQFQSEYKRLSMMRIPSQKSKRWFDLKYRNIYEVSIRNHKYEIQYV